jgi:FtsP/CotA-like multicopper oxidase with cupredoxin domain
MSSKHKSRREFLKVTGLTAGSLFLAFDSSLATPRTARQPDKPDASENESGPADYTVRIQASPIEIAPGYILSTITYNGQFPGPLLRFHEGRQVTVDIFNDTETPEQLHWHGQFVPTDVDGSLQGPPGFASTTPTIVPAPISQPEPIPARRARFTSNRSMSLAGTTAKCSWC